MLAMQNTPMFYPPNMAPEDKASMVRNMLNEARNALQHGNTGVAMEHVVAAITLAAGPNAVQIVLQRAQRAECSAGSNDAIDEISALLDGLDIEKQGGGSCVQPVSILSDDTISVALQDGSSYTCPACGGVVSRERQAAHEGAWCPAHHA